MDFFLPKKKTKTHWHLLKDGWYSSEFGQKKRTIQNVSESTHRAGVCLLSQLLWTFLSDAGQHLGRLRDDL